jgi:predicted ribosome quality control (RQC) complex YloA/Tae2 family protein
MESLILEAVVRGLARDLPGNHLLRVQRAGAWEYLLRFATAAGPHLLIRLRPPHPVLHPVSSRESAPELPPDPFASLLGRELEAAMLERVERPGFDRVVEASWKTRSGHRRILVAELIGKSANLLLLDERRKVLGFAREMASSFRIPVEGESYHPPVPRRGMEEITLDPARAGEYLERFAAEGSPLEAAAAFLRGLSPPLGGDFPLREEAVADPAGALAAILGEAGAGRIDPRLYTSRPVEEMLRDPSASDAMPVLSPFPLRRSPLPVETRFRDAGQAAGMTACIQERLRSYREVRERIAAALERESGKLQRLEEKLREELRESNRWEEFQRFGDLILAHPDARVVGSSISVPNLYDPAGSRAEIPADPSLSPRENAERHYSRARKLRRGAGTIGERLESTRARVRRLEEWRVHLQSAKGEDGLRDLASALEEARLLRPEGRRATRRPLPPAERDAGVRKFRTVDGFMILVGRTAADNDRLTFQMASPHDFWLHAADRSGAHVVVRNPGKLSVLPRPVLLAAAQIAAHFSRARGKGKVEVHVTLRKYVRKGRGFGPGRVMLRNHRTLSVEPALPGSEEG